ALIHPAMTNFSRIISGMSHSLLKFAERALPDCDVTRPWFSVQGRGLWRASLGGPQGRPAGLATACVALSR
ncbi:MAG: hypothetical protein O9972_55115, partial [Burkholderiales bacterium]|nr:hypothetical protein [Burkholderiales bacterium]